MKNYLCKWVPPRADFLETMSDDEKIWMGQHGDFLNKLLDQGVIVAHGPVINDGNGYGLSLYQIADEEDVASFTSQDPIVKNGVGHYEHYIMLHLASHL
ncbi:YciI family protein [Acinetobacter sp. GN11]